MRNAAVVVVLLLAVAAPVFGEQSTTDPQASMRFGALRSKKPQRQLFAAQLLTDANAKAKAAPMRPKVVCGILIVPADPTIDPKMRVTPPQDPNLEYKIRVVEPPSCKTDR